MSRVHFGRRMTTSLFHKTRPHPRIRTVFQAHIRFASTSSGDTPTRLAPPNLQSDDDLLGEVFELSEKGLSALATEVNELVLDDKFTYYTVEDFWMAKFLPIRTFHTCFDILHDYMPWWGIAIFLPWVMKFCLTIPLAVRASKKQEKIMAQIPDATAEMQKFYGKLKASDPDRQEKSRKISQYIKEKYGFNPMTASIRPALTNMVQAPVHITMFIAIRTMFPEFPTWKTDGGMLWFKDLSIPDETWALPAFASLCMVANGRLIQVMGDRNGSDTALMGYVAMAGSIPMFFFGLYYFSSGFTLYTMSNILSYGFQAYVLQTDRTRSLLGLKPMSYQNEYSRQMTNIRAQMKAMEDDSKKKEIVANRRVRRKVT